MRPISEHPDFETYKTDNDFIIAKLKEKLGELKYAGQLCYAEARKRSLSDGTPETIDALIAWETLQSKGDRT